MASNLIGIGMWSETELDCVLDGPFSSSVIGFALVCVWCVRWRHLRWRKEKKKKKK